MRNKRPQPSACSGAEQSKQRGRGQRYISVSVRGEKGCEVQSYSSRVEQLCVESLSTVEMKGGMLKSISRQD